MLCVTDFCMRMKVVDFRMRMYHPTVMCSFAHLYRKKLRHFSISRVHTRF